jgi:predicted CXXCH cytochrome family protein
VKNHVLRPLFVALGVVVLILIARAVIVPADFGVGERGYMYGWHRKGNEADWKAVTVKYRGTAYCKECHEDKYRDIVDSPHGSIQCENCHGPALGHPKDPPTLPTDRKRELCLRCHYKLPYETSQRGRIKGVNSATHHPQEECVLCHYPHNPKRPPQQEVKR